MLVFLYVHTPILSPELLTVHNLHLQNHHHYHHDPIITPYPPLPIARHHLYRNHHSQMTIRTRHSFRFVDLVVVCHPPKNRFQYLSKLDRLLCQSSRTCTSLAVLKAKSFPWKLFGFLFQICPGFNLGQQYPSSLICTEVNILIASSAQWRFFSMN